MALVTNNRQNDPFMNQPLSIQELFTRVGAIGGFNPTSNVNLGENVIRNLKYWQSVLAGTPQGWQGIQVRPEDYTMENLQNYISLYNSGDPRLFTGANKPTIQFDPNTGYGYLSDLSYGWTPYGFTTDVGRFGTDWSTYGSAPPGSTRRRTETAPPGKTIPGTMNAPVPGVPGLPGSTAIPGATSCFGGGQPGPGQTRLPGTNQTSTQVSLPGTAGTPQQTVQRAELPGVSQTRQPNPIIQPVQTTQTQNPGMPLIGQQSTGTTTSRSEGPSAPAAPRMPSSSTTTATPAPSTTPMNSLSIMTGQQSPQTGNTMPNANPFDIFGSNALTNTGSNALMNLLQTGNPITAMPTYEAMTQVLNQNAQREAADTLQSFLPGGLRSSSASVRGVGDVTERLQAQKNALLAGLTQQSLENAAGRQQSAIPQLFGGQQSFMNQLLGLYNTNLGAQNQQFNQQLGAGQFGLQRAGLLGGLSQMAQSDLMQRLGLLGQAGQMGTQQNQDALNRAYQEFMRTQNALLPFYLSLATNTPFSPSQPSNPIGGISSLLGGAGGALSGLGSAGCLGAGAGAGGAGALAALAAAF